ncbi:MAG: HAD family hydrolase [Bacteroidota bacterium]
MPIETITFDFWNTIVDAKVNGRQRHEDRMAFMEEVYRAHQPDATRERLDEAVEEARKAFDQSWEHEHRTLGAADLLGVVWTHLEVEPAPDEAAEAVRRFEEGLLDAPPALAEGIADAIRWATGRYRLSIISDTMFSPGRILRGLLEQHGLLSSFTSTVFSDEMGYSKPDQRAFDTALTGVGGAADSAVHIGDIRRTDVAGANEAGMKSLLYTGIRVDAPDAPLATAEFASWRDLPAVLSRL